MALSSLPKQLVVIKKISRKVLQLTHYCNTRRVIRFMLLLIYFLNQSRIIWSFINITNVRHGFNVLLKNQSRSYFKKQNCITKAQCKFDNLQLPMKLTKTASLGRKKSTNRKQNYFTIQWDSQFDTNHSFIQPWIFPSTKIWHSKLILRCWKV